MTIAYRRALTLVAAVFIAMFAFTFFSDPAFASTECSAPCMPGGIDGEASTDDKDGNTGVPPETDGQPKPGDGDNGNGDGYDGGPPPAEWEWITYKVNVDFAQGIGSYWDPVWHKAVERCESKNNAVGATVTHRRKYYHANDSLGSAHGDFEYVGSKCIYLDITTSTATCIISGEIVVEMRQPDQKVIDTVRGNGGWKDGMTNPRKCENSKVSLSIKTPITELGRYRLRTYLVKQQVTITRTSNPLTPDVPPTREVTAWRTPTTTIGNSYGQLTCEEEGGWRHGGDRSDVYVGDWTFTHTDCGPDSGPDPQSGRYSCTPVDPSLPGRAINGVERNNATLFRDGEPNELSWSVLRPTPGEGFKQTGEGRTRFLRNADGTPWKETGQDPLFYLGLNENKTNNNRLAKHETRTPWLNGVYGTAYARGYWASASDRPTEITPRWRYEGTLKVRTPSSVSYDSETGKWTFTYGKRRVESTAICEGKRIRLNFVRSITTN